MAVLELTRRRTRPRLNMSGRMEASGSYVVRVDASWCRYVKEGLPQCGMNSSQNINYPILLRTFNSPDWQPPLLSTVLFLVSPLP